MTNITLSPPKTKLVSMENLRAIASGKKPATNRYPKGDYDVHSCGVYISGIQIGFVLKAEIQNGYTSETKIQWATIKLDDMIAFVKKHGAFRLVQDAEGNWIQQRFTPDNIKKFVYADKWDVAKRMLNAGEVSHD